MLSPLGQRGLTLLELVLSLTIMSVAFIGLDSMSERFSQDTKNTLVAAHMRTFGDAVKAYVKTNQTEITSTLINSPAVLIDATTLVKTGYLSQSQATLIAGTTNYQYTNGYRQNLCALVIKPTLGPLQALVVAEGGETIDDLSLGGIAALIGGSGGSYPTTVIDGDSTNAIKGAVGAWKVDPTVFNGKMNNLALNCGHIAGQVTVAAGRPVMALWFDTTSGLPLVRNKVGPPGLNTMETPLILGDSAVGVSGSACTKGAIARSTLGALLYCDSSLVWKEITATYWRDPVTKVASLPAGGNNIGDVRVTTDEAYNAPYIFVRDAQGNAVWKTLTVEKNGDLNVGVVNASGLRIPNSNSNGRPVIISSAGDITSESVNSTNGSFSSLTSRSVDSTSGTFGSLTSSGNISGATLSATGDIVSNTPGSRFILAGDTFASSTINAGVDLTGNKISGQQFILTKVGSGESCDISKDIGYKASSSDGTLMRCSNDKWSPLYSTPTIPQVMRGTMCGSVQWIGNAKSHIFPCGTHEDIAYGCPDFYSLIRIMGEQNKFDTQLWTCRKD